MADETKRKRAPLSDEARIVRAFALLRGLTPGAREAALGDCDPDAIEAEAHAIAAILRHRAALSAASRATFLAMARTLDVAGERPDHDADLFEEPEER